MNLDSSRWGMLLTMVLIGCGQQSPGTRDPGVSEKKIVRQEKKIVMKETAAPVQGTSDILGLSFRVHRVKLSYSDKGAPLNLDPDMTPTSAITLSASAPEVKLPSFKTHKQWYGLLTLAGQSWNFVVDGDARGKGVLWVDRNQNRDLSDDGDPVACQWENSVFGGDVTLLVPSGTSAPPQPYRLFLITTVGMEGQDQSAPQAVYYATGYWTGTVFPENDKTTGYGCFVYDNPADLNFENDVVVLDLNSNGTAEDLERFRPGVLRRVGRNLIMFNRVDAREMAAEFLVAPYSKEVERLALPDVLTELAKLPITGNLAPVFQSRDMAGAILTLADYRGKIVLIDFWATWCGPCVREMPNVIRVYEKFKDKDFRIVGISLDQAQKDLEDFIAERKIAWPQLFDGRGFEGNLPFMYGVRSIPSAFLVDRKGIIRAVGLRGEDLMKKVEELLEQKD